MEGKDSSSFLLLKPFPSEVKNPSRAERHCREQPLGKVSSCSWMLEPFSHCRERTWQQEKALPAPHCWSLSLQQGKTLAPPCQTSFATVKGSGSGERRFSLLPPLYQSLSLTQNQPDFHCAIVTQGFQNPTQW